MEQRPRDVNIQIKGLNKKGHRINDFTLLKNPFIITHLPTNQNRALNNTVVHAIIIAE